MFVSRSLGDHLLWIAAYRRLFKHFLRKSLLGLGDESMCLCEQDLLVLLAEDSERYFDMVVTTYQQKLFAFVFLKVCHRQDAEDIVQEALIHAFYWLKSRSSHEIKQMNLRPWLFKIAYHGALNHLTRGGKRSSQLVSLDCSEERAFLESVVCGRYASPEKELEEQEVYHELYICIQQLPDHYRLPLLLHYIVGLSYREVAEILQQPFNTAKSNGRRGLEKLQKMLQQTDGMRKEED